MNNTYTWISGFVVGFSFGSFFISKRVKSVIEKIKGHQCPPQTIHVFGPGGGGGSEKPPAPDDK